MAKEYSKPYYGIHLDLAQVGIDLRLNDIPVYYDDEKGQVTVDLPAPTSIIDGKNELTIIAFTPFIDDDNRMESFLPGSEITASLYVQEIDDPENNKEILTSISITFNENHEAVVTDSQDYKSTSPARITHSSKEKAIVSRSVNINSPFPRWAWQDGQVIENNTDNFNSLLKAYKRIYDAFSDRDQKTIIKLYDERARETAIAYHLIDISDGHKKISTGEDIKNTSLELQEFWQQGMKLDIYANGKLARIVDEFYGEPILFVDKEAGLMHWHKFGFYKNKNDEWIMIR